MKKNCGVVLRYSVLLTVLLFISACAAKLIDVDKSASRLNLSEEQLEVVKPKLESIRELADTYDEKKELFEEEINSMKGSGRDSGKRGEFREKFQEFRKQRETYLSAINIHVADIKAVLDKEQLAVFEKMDLPELEMPETPGGQRRGMGGRGGGKGSGMGGRGGRRDTF